MAGSVTQYYDLIEASQSQKEVTANALFEAASPAMIYARRAKTSAGFTWGYYGGDLLIDGQIVSIPNGTFQLTPERGNWIEADPSTGQISLNNTGFTAGRLPLYLILTGADYIVGYQDLRSAYTTATTAASSSLAAHLAASDPHPQYLTQAEADALYDDLGAGTAAASAAVSAHEAAGDPHPQYLTQTEADARYLQSVGAQPFDLTAFYPGAPTASALVTRIPFARAVSFPAGLAGSVAKAKTAATAQADFDIQKNGVSVGTIRFAAAATSATFIAASAFALAAGDLLSIVAPAAADATLADIGFVLAGTR
jgi:hypothetical protein